MKTRVSTDSIPKNIIIRVALVTGFILLIPLVGMQFSDEVEWSLPDFVIIGALVFSAGTVYELLAKKVVSSKQRIIIGLVLLAVLMLVWAEIAVGVFATPFAGN